MGVGVILLCGGAFFSDCHRALRGEELRIRLPAPQGVQEKDLVEVVEAGPRTPPAVARLLGPPRLDGGPAGAVGLRVVPGKLARRLPATPASTTRHGRQERKGDER